jgi:hypothetical protein
VNLRRRNRYMSVACGAHGMPQQASPYHKGTWNNKISFLTKS